MTREEAIIYIMNLREYMKMISEESEYGFIEENYIDLDMAIKILEQEPCEDAVSRQALIERINNAEENFKADHMESIASDDGDAFVDGVLSGVFNIREMVAQAPSVTPTRMAINENIKALGEELRKVREGITDEKVLIGFNMAIAICNKYLGESEE